MTTIGYKDRTGGPIREYYHQNEKAVQQEFGRQKKWDRIKEALQELRHTGNINIYLIKGNNARLISQKGW